MARQYKFDSTEGTFTTSKGGTFTLDPVSFVWLQDFQARLKEKRPEIPMVRVDYGNEQHGWEANPNDMAYLQKLSDWTEYSNAQVMRMLFNLGVQEDPSDDDLKRLERYAEYLKANDLNDKKPTRQDLKYMWVSSLLGDENEVQALIQYIVGQTTPTQEGMEEAAETFRGDG